VYVGRNTRDQWVYWPEHTGQKRQRPGETACGARESARPAWNAPTRGPFALVCAATHRPRQRHRRVEARGGLCPHQAHPDPKQHRACWGQHRVMPLAASPCRARGPAECQQPCCRARGQPCASTNNAAHAARGGGGGARPGTKKSRLKRCKIIRALRIVSGFCCHAQQSPCAAIPPLPVAAAVPKVSAKPEPSLVRVKPVSGARTNPAALRGAVGGAA